MSMLLVIGMYALWSSVFTLGKMAVAFAPPLFLTGFRMLIAAFILLVYLAIRNRSQFSLKKKQWFSLALFGFFSIYLSNICELWGLKYLSSAKTCFIYSLSPLFTVFFSYLHFKEKMNGWKWMGLGVCFLGCIPVLLTQTGSEEIFQGNFLSWPTIAVIGAVVFSSYGWILLRINLKDTTVSPLMASGTSMLFGGGMALIHSLFSDAWTPIPIVPGHFLDVLQGVLCMTLVSNIICSNLYGAMLRKYTATFLSFVGLLSPIFASLHGWLFLSESPSWVILLSTGAVVFGLWIVYREELKQGYIQPSSIPSEPVNKNTTIEALPE